MDLNTVTVADFKAYFKRDFPYLPVFSITQLYNVGNRVYYPTTLLFYACKVNGTIGILPTDATKWEVVVDNVENYVSDDDIAKAQGEAKIAMNQSLFTTDANIVLGFMYLTAHYLVNDLKAANGGIFGGASFTVESRAVGNVHEKYMVPDAYKDNPIYAAYATDTYGMKFLALALPAMVGNVVAVWGGTRP